MKKVFHKFFYVDKKNLLKWVNFFNKKHQLFTQLVFYAVTVLVIIWLIIFFYYRKEAYNNNLKFYNNSLRAQTIYNAIPAWRKKIIPSKNVKIGIITDTHINLLSQINRKHIAIGQSGFLKFIKEMKNFQPDFMVHLGDIIDGTRNPDYFGIKQLDLIKQYMSNVNTPIYWLAGNHDLRSITPEQFKKTFKLKSLYYTIDKDNYRFIFLDANYNKQNLHRSPHQNKFIPGHLSPSEINWLKKQLNTRKRVFVFMHQGLFPGKTTPYANKIVRPINNFREVRQLLDEYRVDGFFNGHMEVRAYHHGQYTHYYSLTGTKQNPYYPQSFYELNIVKGVPNLTMFYYSPREKKDKQIEFEKESNFYNEKAKNN